MRTPVRRGDLDLGVVLHDPKLAEMPDTLDSVLRAAGLAMEIARLRVEVRVQLAEVRAAQARLSVAAEAERRKLERDLHDGAQQRLVALGLALRHAQHQLRDSPDSAINTLDGAVGEVATAVAELRAIARGLRPSLLDAGLGPALADVAGRAPLPVAVEVAPQPLAPDVEATLFYLACEGLTNIVKHADARHARIHVHTTGAGTRIEVADDGSGGAVASPGGGLDGMVARVAHHGGTLELHSPPGGGTRVIADLPGGS
jgi:signal transduction histidine kinase